MKGMKYYVLFSYYDCVSPKGPLFAEGITYADSGNYDYTKPRKVCPLCGTMVEGFVWLEPHNVKLSSKRVGDFVDVCPVGWACNESTKNLMQQCGIRGIGEFLPINTFYKKDCPTERSYYVMQIAYSNKKYDYAVQQNERRKYDKSLPKCSLCKRSGNGKLDNFREIYFNDQDEYDIFKVYEKPTDIFCNERFIQFCKDHGLTNIVERFKEV